MKKLSTPAGSVILILALALVSLAVLSMTFRNGLYNHSEGRPVTELPPDVKRTLTPSPAAASDSATPQVKPVRYPILMYHYVEIVKDRRDTIRQSLDTQPGVLQKQIETLKSAGYTFITPSEATDMILGRKPWVQKPITLSFDDGYGDFYTDVFPILQKEGVKAVSYVVPGFIDHPNYMTLPELLDVASDPRIEIGAHTMHHVWLKGAREAVAWTEIDGSRAALETLLKRPIVSFAYPYGAFDKETLALVARAGFTNAASTVPGIEQSEANRFFLYRLRPGARTGNILLTWLKQGTFKAYPSSL
ncbi:polysaccharide deacetylase family protein [Patescibacteria group bacterium]|nr:polysaccharide deacetylase family protein [Patescibacteria group bacterium]